MTTVGVALLALAILFAFFPRLLAYPLGIVFAWMAIALFYKSYKLHRKQKRATREMEEETTPAQTAGARHRIKPKRN